MAIVLLTINFVELTLLVGTFGIVCLSLSLGIATYSRHANSVARNTFARGFAVLMAWMSGWICYFVHVPYYVWGWAGCITIYIWVFLWFWLPINDDIAAHKVAAQAERKHCG